MNRVAVTTGAMLSLMLASAAAAQPVVRGTIREKPPLVVGQQVHIDVQLLVPNFFMSSPRFPTLDIPGAVVTLADDAVNLNETIKGSSYAGIQRSYVFVAQAAGRYAIPAAGIEFRYAVEPGKPLDASAPLPALSLTIALPAGMTPPADGSTAAVSRITITQTLDRDPSSLHAGDALTRIIRMTAAQTQAMFIPPVSFPDQDGVRVYRKDPSLVDDADGRGALVAGHRTERVVYTFERAGRYAIPAIDVPWFNVAAKRTETASAPAITVVVGDAASSAAIAPEPPPVPPPSTEPRWQRRSGARAGVAIAALMTIVLLRRVLMRIGLAVLHAVTRLWAAARRDRATHLPPLNPL